MVDGAMDAHSQFVAAHLRFGDRVAVEQPCFPPLLDLLEMAGVLPIGVGYDAHGPVVADVVAAVEAGAKVLFFQPWGQNPSGQSVSRVRAGELAAALAGRDVVVVEDDSAGGTPSGAPVSLGAFLPDRTVLVRSFSKTHGPDLRLAAIGGPAAVVGPLVERRFLGQGWSSRLVQSILLQLLTDESSRALVADAQATYAGRTAAMADALAARGIDVPGRDGINVWVPVAEQGAALLHLAAAGVRAASGDPFWISTAGDRPHPGHHLVDRRRPSTRPARPPRARRPHRRRRPGRHLVRPALRTLNRLLFTPGQARSAQASPGFDSPVATSFLGRGVRSTCARHECLLVPRSHSAALTMILILSENRSHEALVGRGGGAGAAGRTHHRLPGATLG